MQTTEISDAPGAATPRASENQSLTKEIGTSIMDHPINSNYSCCSAIGQHTPECRHTALVGLAVSIQADVLKAVELADDLESDQRARAHAAASHLIDALKELLLLRISMAAHQ